MLTNADIKRLSGLKERDGRKEQGLFFIEGKRAVAEAITGGASIRSLLVSLGANPKRLSDIYALAGEKEIEIEELPAAKFNKLSSTETSQGIIAVAAVRELTSDELLAELRPKRNATVLLLDRISDPGNLGTILRSASWFGVDGVFIAAGSVDAYNPKVVRSAMAAICQLDVA
ncbi:MAG: RNA methyltransferase, partial [Bacteroidetes bacterium]|nr:RNA methyltransferase [Bacteroidota bacterium]